MASTSSLARLAVIAAGASFFFHACSSSYEGGSPRYDGGQGGKANVGGTNVIMPDASAPLGGEGGDGALNPLCAAVTCNPDDVESCADFVSAGGASQQVISLGGAGDGGLGGGGAGGHDGGAGPSAGAGLGGVGGSSGGHGSGFGEGGDAGAGPGAPGFACRVARERTTATTECSPVGRGQVGGPCFDSSNCGAGLACVAEGAIGRCRPFCCRGESTCDLFPGTYCAVRELLEDPAPAKAFQVPVCMTAEHCDLGEPPCDAGADCECAPGTACQVVRADGTTACVPPGTGTAGMPCPCAYGFVCSQAANRCLPLCRTSASEPGSAGAGGSSGASCGRCQASAELPDGWGVCIGN